MNDLADNKKSIQKIQCEGPIDSDNGALIFRLPRDEKKGDLDIYKGQFLIVGEEITKDEAKQLLNSSSWKFSEVTE